MATGGVGEAALLAAAAESAAAASAVGGTAAATAAALTAAEAAAAAGTAGAAAAAAAPEIAAAAAPSLALAAAPTAAETAATVAAPALAETAATTGSTTPIFLGAAESEPLLGAGLSGTARPEALLGTVGTPEGVPLAGQSGVTVGTEAFGPAESQGWLLDKAGAWWNQASLGEKLGASGKLLSGVGTAAKAAQPPPSQGPKTTLRPGTTGKPMGGEQQLAAIIDAMLKRRDAYQQNQLGGVPVVYRPRGLLG